MKKKILIIITGGTITMKDYNDSIDISEKLLSKLNSSNVLSSYDLDYEVEIFSSKPSPNFSCYDMFSLCRYIEKKILTNSFDGFVIAHGTDTIEETSFFLDLYFSDLKFPIVFTGSMKTFFDPSYDGYENLISSVLVASKNQAKKYGVLIAFNNNIISALGVSKFHTQNIDSFKSINIPYVGNIQNGIVSFNYIPNRFILSKISKIKNNIFIYKSFSGDNGLFLKYNNVDFDGLIIEGFGNGNLPENLLYFLRNTINKKIPIIISSRVPDGLLFQNYSYPGGGKNLSKLGCLFNESLNSQKLRILLVYLTSLDYSFFDIQKFFSK